MEIPAKNLPDNSVCVYHSAKNNHILHIHRGKFAGNTKNHHYSEPELVEVLHIYIYTI